MRYHCYRRQWDLVATTEQVWETNPVPSADFLHFTFLLHLWKLHFRTSIRQFPKSSRNWLPDKTSPTVLNTPLWSLNSSLLIPRRPNVFFRFVVILQIIVKIRFCGTKSSSNVESTSRDMDITLNDFRLRFSVFTRVSTTQACLWMASAWHPSILFDHKVEQTERISTMMSSQIPTTTHQRTEMSSTAGATPFIGRSTTLSIGTSQPPASVSTNSDSTIAPNPPFIPFIAMSSGKVVWLIGISYINFLFNSL